MTQQSGPAGISPILDSKLWLRLNHPNYARSHPIAGDNIAR